MEFTGLGGGILLAIAAALWLVYLVPNWLKRREYLATERNAVRLQQTIRVLAETAEMPDAVRADVAAKRLGHTPVAVGRPVTLPLPVREDPLALAARRLRRTRAATALVFASAIIVLIVQLGLIVSTGAVAGSWLVLGGAALLSLTALAMLGRLAEVSRKRMRQRAPRVARRTSLGYAAAPQQAAAEPEVRTEWTPVPVPKPMYLSRGSRGEAPAATLGDTARELAEAAARAEQALRDAAPAVPASPATAAPAPAASTAAHAPAASSAAPAPAGSNAAPAPGPAPSRFARMGIVDDAELRAPDLDEVLARRRAV